MALKLPPEMGPSGILSSDGKPVESPDREVALLCRPVSVKSRVGDGTLQFQFDLHSAFGVIAMDGQRRGPLRVYGAHPCVFAISIPLAEAAEFMEAMNIGGDKAIAAIEAGKDKPTDPPEGEVSH